MYKGLQQILRTIFLLLTGLLLVGLTRVDSSDYYMMEVSYSFRQRDIIKDVACMNTQPGSIKEIQGYSFFKPYQEKLRNLRRKKKRDNNPKIRKRFKKIRMLFKAGLSVCSGTTTDGEEKNTTTVELPEEKYFEANGDVTTLGREVLGIPDGLEANIKTGYTVWQSYCVGCHEERRKKTFSELRLAISQEPMYYIDEYLPDSDLAQIVAYVSRFRRPGN